MNADEPAPSFQEPIEDPPKPDEPDRIGICCSGGGIRSASFNLGVLQEIGPTRLQEAKYLAAVSGGAYIAGAFAMVANTRTPPPNVNSSPDLVDQERPPFHPGSPEEQYLRNRVSYLAPSGGGMLRLIWRVICGLIVNLALFTSAAVLIATAVALYYRRFEPGLDNAAGGFKADPGPWIFWTPLGIAAFGLLLSVVLILWRPRNESISRGLEGWSLRLTIVGGVLFALAVVLPELLVELRQGRNVGETTRVIGRSIGGTIAGILFAVLLQIKARAADPKETAREIGKMKSWLDSLARPVRRLVVAIAAYVLGPLLLLAIFTGATLLQVAAEGWWLVAIPAIAAVVFGWLYFWGDLTSWSLHPYYRRRLCTAFALKRVKRLDSNGNEITDDEVGRAVERDQRQLVRLSETRVVPAAGKWASSKWPTLLVCAAANVSDPGATPPGRSVTSFTFSSETLGGPLVGGIPTATFEMKLGEKRQRDFNLPAVVAMSGAALSPSMGKHTRSSLRFLMGLANVRLGVWVPNPRRVDEFIPTRKELLRHFPRTRVGKIKLYCNPSPALTEHERATLRHEAEYDRKAAPRPRPIYLLKELLGMTSVNDKFLYITDGGHYENLGLVELLRRGCTRIYCFDASGGSRGLNDLGDAIALARAELGVEVEFTSTHLGELAEDEKTGFAKRSCAIGTVRYHRGKGAKGAVGTIIYAPSVMTPEVPFDLQAFKKVDAAFPHHSTVDQLFTDQKFEAYRALGRHAAQESIAAMDKQKMNGSFEVGSPERTRKRSSFGRVLENMRSRVSAREPTSL